MVTHHIEMRENPDTEDICDTTIHILHTVGSSKEVQDNTHNDIVADFVSMHLNFCGFHLVCAKLHRNKPRTN